jgi:hypothetical protein
MQLTAKMTKILCKGRKVLKNMALTLRTLLFLAFFAC